LGFVVALVGMMGAVPLGAAAQSAPVPTLGEVVVDGYDCGTGVLSFHVPVTDLPHLPDSNGSLGYSIVAHYEQGDPGSLVFGFNPDPQGAPYTGDVYLSADAAPSGEDASFPQPEPASGPLASVDVVVYLVAAAGEGLIDTRGATYPVDCAGAGAAAPAPAPPAGADAGDTDPGDAVDAGATGGGDASGAETTGGGDAAGTGTGDTAGMEAGSGGSGAGDTITLPNTGAGTVPNGPADALLVALLGSIAALSSVAALRIRRQS